MNKKISKNFFIYIFILWYSTEILFNSTIIYVDSRLMNNLNLSIGYLVLVALLVQLLFFQRYSAKELSIIGIVSVIVLASTINSSYANILSLWLFIISAQNIDFDYIVNLAYKILIFMIGLIIVLNFFGIISDYTVYRDGIIRYSLGFSHPNQLGLRLFQLIACHFYINRNNLLYRDFVLAIIVAAFVKIVPNSQTSYISIILLLLFSFIYIFLIRFSKSIRNRLTSIMIVISAFVNVISLFLSTRALTAMPIAEKVNDFLSQRFFMCYRVYCIYGISLLGQNVTISSAERSAKNLANYGSLFLDNAYMALLLRYGLLMYIVFSLLYIIHMIYLQKKEKYFLLGILFVYSIYGIMEQGLFLLSHNIMLLSMAGLLYKINIDSVYENEVKKRIVFKIVYRYKNSN